MERNFDTLLLSHVRKSFLIQVIDVQKKIRERMEKNGLDRALEIRHAHRPASQPFDLWQEVSLVTFSLRLTPVLRLGSGDVESSAIPAEGLSVNGLWAVWPSIVLYDRSARNPIEQDRSFMRPCSPTLGVVIPRHTCKASC
ncbi:MAG: hypothetical protein ACREBU_15540 [Nitrososphaera sp.]